MNRSGYSDDIDNSWDLIRWRGAVNSAINGKRGQAFLQELHDVMAALPPEKRRLIKEDLSFAGEHCTLGLMYEARGISTEGVDPGEHSRIGKQLNIASAMVQEIEWFNDEAEYWRDTTPEARFERMFKWVKEQLKAPANDNRDEHTETAG